MVRLDTFAYIFLLCLLLLLTACGGGGSSGGDVSANSTNSPIPTPGVTPIPTPMPTAIPIPIAPVVMSDISLYAGQIGGEGNVDGQGSKARFSYLKKIELAPNGNILALDGAKIRTITPSGQVNTIRDWIPADNMTQAADGAIYFVTNNGRQIKKITADGKELLVAGLSSPERRNYIDGPIAIAEFESIGGIAVANDGTIFVSEASSHVIRKIGTDGNVTTIAGKKGVWGDANGFAALFTSPSELHIDSEGELIVVDGGSKRRVRMISKTGEVFPLWEHKGMLSGVGVAPSDHGTVYTIEGNHVIEVSKNGTAVPVAELNTNSLYSGYPQYSSLAVGKDGVIYIADNANYVILKIANQQLSIHAGAAPQVGSNDGSLRDARFYFPSSMAVHDADVIYVGDYRNHTIRMIGIGDRVRTLAGQVGKFEIKDGQNAVLGGISHIVRAKSGLLYFVDNHFIREFGPEGVKTIAGSNQSGYKDGQGKNAQFGFISGLAVADDGTLYVSERESSVIRKIDRDGNVTTLAGIANNSGYADGQGANAKFNKPSDLIINHNGDILVADSENSAIRKVSPLGVVTTIAGTPNKKNWDSSEDNFRPIKITLADDGSIYVLNELGSRSSIKKLSPSGELANLMPKPGVGSFFPGGVAAMISKTTAIAWRNQELYLLLSSESSIVKVKFDK